MPRSDQYRRLATQVRDRAVKEKNQIVKAEWENLAMTYIRLAEQSERNGGQEATYDPIADMQKRAR